MFWNENGYQAISGTPDVNPIAYQSFTPSKLINAQSPPCILFHGLVDGLVPLQYSQDIVDRGNFYDISILKIDIQYGPHAFDFNPIYRSSTLYYLERWMAMTMLI